MQVKNNEAIPTLERIVLVAPISGDKIRINKNEPPHSAPRVKSRNMLFDKWIFLFLLFMVKGFHG